MILNFCKLKNQGALYSLTKVCKLVILWVSNNLKVACNSYQLVFVVDLTNY